MVMLAPYMVMLAPYMVVLAPYMVMLAPYMVMLAPNMVMLAPYMVVLIPYMGNTMTMAVYYTQIDGSGCFDQIWTHWLHWGEGEGAKSSPK